MPHGRRAPVTPREPGAPEGPGADTWREVRLPSLYDFDASTRFLPFGLHDPTCRRTRSVLWRGGRAPAGPFTLRLAHRREPDSLVRASAWGPGAVWILERVEPILGLDDDPGAFAPPRGPVATLARRGRGLHLARVPWVLDVLTQFILQQRVSFRDAARGWGRLVRAAGDAAPGPPGLLLPLSPRHWLRLSSEDFRRADVDGQRAGRLRAAARRAAVIESTFARGRNAAREALSATPGCGPWTVEMVMGFGLGDPDAVPTGDLHLPGLLGHALAGEPDADDARMLELLEPWRGDRFRLIRLLLGADRIRLGRDARG